jgi:hypothetical protein
MSGPTAAEVAWATARGYDLKAPHWNDFPPEIRTAVTDAIMIATTKERDTTTLRQRHEAAIAAGATLMIGRPTMLETPPAPLGYGRCATCRWAEAFTPQRDIELCFWGYGSDASGNVALQGARADGYFAFCQRAETTDGDGTRGGVVALTDSGHCGLLVVSPDFGCVMYEAHP